MENALDRLDRTTSDPASFVSIDTTSPEARGVVASYLGLLAMFDALRARRLRCLDPHCARKHFLGEEPCLAWREEEEEEEFP